MENLKTWQEICGLNITKGELFEDHKLTFDFALPQPWLDSIVEKTGVDYNMVLSTTVWSYADNRFPQPLTVCQEVQEAIETFNRR